MSVIRQQLRSLGALLLERGLVKQIDLDAALNEQKNSGEKLGRILVRRGLVTEANIVTALEGIMVVVFNLGADEFAMPSLEVREIIRHRPALPLPGAPSYLEGIELGLDLGTIAMAKRSPQVGPQGFYALMSLGIFGLSAGVVQDLQQTCLCRIRRHRLLKMDHCFLGASGFEQGLPQRHTRAHPRVVQFKRASVGHDGFVQLTRILKRKTIFKGRLGVLGLSRQR